MRRGVGVLARMCDRVARALMRVHICVSCRRMYKKQQLSPHTHSNCAPGCEPTRVP